MAAIFRRKGEGVTALLALIRVRVRLVPNNQDKNAPISMSGFKEVGSAGEYGIPGRAGTGMRQTGHI
jgi:hypothetical protein